MTELEIAEARMCHASSADIDADPTAHDAWLKYSQRLIRECRASWRLTLLRQFFIYEDMPAGMLTAPQPPQKFTPAPITAISDSYPQSAVFKGAKEPGLTLEWEPLDSADDRRLTIKEFIDQTGWHLPIFALKVGIDKSTMRAIKNQHYSPGKDIRQRIAKAFGLPVDAIRYPAKIAREMAS